MFLSEAEAGSMTQTSGEVTLLQTLPPFANISRLRLSLQIFEIEPTNTENSKESTKAEGSGHIIACHNVRLFIGGESEDWNPRGKNVCESVHLSIVRCQSLDCTSRLCKAEEKK